MTSRFPSVLLAVILPVTGCVCARPDVQVCAKCHRASAQSSTRTALARRGVAGATYGELALARAGPRPWPVGPIQLAWLLDSPDPDVALIAEMMLDELGPAGLEARPVLLQYVDRGQHLGQVAQILGDMDSGRGENREPLLRILRGEDMWGVTHSAVAFRKRGLADEEVIRELGRVAARADTAGVAARRSLEDLAVEAQWKDLAEAELARLRGADAASSSRPGS